MSDRCKLLLYVISFDLFYTDQQILYVCTNDPADDVTSDHGLFNTSPNGRFKGQRVCTRRMHAPDESPRDYKFVLHNLQLPPASSLCLRMLYSNGSTENLPITTSPGDQVTRRGFIRYDVVSVRIEFRKKPGNSPRHERGGFLLEYQGMVPKMCMCILVIYFICIYLSLCFARPAL